MNAAERYRIGYSAMRTGNRWYVYDLESESGEPVGPRLRTRDQAIAAADRANATTAAAGPEKGARFIGSARVGTSDPAAAAAVPETSRVPGGGPG